MIRAQLRRRFIVHFVLQATHPRLVGRIGDCWQLRAGIAAPDDFDPNQQVLLEGGCVHMLRLRGLIQRRGPIARIVKERHR
jgi:hypothetical protein